MPPKKPRKLAKSRQLSSVCCDLGSLFAQLPLDVVQRNVWMLLPSHSRQALGLVSKDLRGLVQSDLVDRLQVVVVRAYLERLLKSKRSIASCFQSLRELELQLPECMRNERGRLDTRIQHDFLANIGTCPHVHTLRLTTGTHRHGCWKLAAHITASIATAFPKLRSLTVARCTLVAGAVFTPLTACTSLATLEVVAALRNTVLAQATIASLAALTSLRHLTLSTFKPADELTALSSLTGLVSLSWKCGSEWEASKLLPLLQTATMQAGLQQLECDGDGPSEEQLTEVLSAMSHLCCLRLTNRDLLTWDLLANLHALTQLYCLGSMLQAADFVAAQPHTSLQVLEIYECLDWVGFIPPMLPLLTALRSFSFAVGLDELPPEPEWCDTMSRVAQGVAEHASLQEVKLYLHWPSSGDTSAAATVLQLLQPVLPKLTELEHATGEQPISEDLLQPLVVHATACPRVKALGFYGCRWEQLELLRPLAAKKDLEFVYVRLEDVVVAKKGKMKGVLKHSVKGQAAAKISDVTGQLAAAGISSDVSGVPADLAACARSLLPGDYVSKVTFSEDD